jgi:hypothetical protein
MKPTEAGIVFFLGCSIAVTSYLGKEQEHTEVSQERELPCVVGVMSAEMISTSTANPAVLIDDGRWFLPKK